MLELSFSSKLDWGSYMISIAKTISKKNWSLSSFYQVLFAWGCSMQGHGSFHRWPCMKHCCHVWGIAPSCYLKTLDKWQKRICWTVGLSVTASLEPLAHPQDVASISLFHRYYFGRHSSGLAQLVSLTYSQWRLLAILTDYMIFLSPFLDVTMMSMSTVSFLAKLDPDILCL